mmetsp:Transcript_36174/g.93946  ORF Transcript_36174/g.93946 Transcript_36174/m.93946 type:complete len:282 (-) Transcript_36174:46-891(-)
MARTALRAAAGMLLPHVGFGGGAAGAASLCWRDALPGCGQRQPRRGVTVPQGFCRNGSTRLYDGDGAVPPLLAARRGEPAVRASSRQAGRRVLQHDCAVPGAPRALHLGGGVPQPGRQRARARHGDALHGAAGQQGRRAGPRRHHLQLGRRLTVRGADAAVATALVLPGRDGLPQGAHLQPPAGRLQLRGAAVGGSGGGRGAQGGAHRRAGQLSAASPFPGVGSLRQASSELLARFGAGEVAHGAPAHAWPQHLLVARSTGAAGRRLWRAGSSGMLSQCSA